MSHDQLQSACHLWMWNSYPELRYLFHANFNNLTTETPDARRKMAQMKAKGLVKGTLDYQFYYRGVLHVFDFKIGKDRLSPEQLQSIDIIQRNGGKAYEVRSLEQFQMIIKEII